jgi:hypothetical protein
MPSLSFPNGEQRQDAATTCEYEQRHEIQETRNSDIVIYAKSRGARTVNVKNKD